MGVARIMLANAIQSSLDNYMNQIMAATQSSPYHQRLNFRGFYDIGPSFTTTPIKSFPRSGAGMNINNNQCTTQSDMLVEYK